MSITTSNTNSSFLCNISFVECLLTFKNTVINIHLTSAHKTSVISYFIQVSTAKGNLKIQIKTLFKIPYLCHFSALKYQVSQVQQSDKSVHCKFQRSSQLFYLVVQNFTNTGHHHYVFLGFSGNLSKKPFRKTPLGIQYGLDQSTRIILVNVARYMFTYFFSFAMYVVKGTLIQI